MTSKIKNKIAEYCLASCEYQICTGDTHNKKAVKRAVFLSINSKTN